MRGVVVVFLAAMFLSACDKPAGDPVTATAAPSVAVPPPAPEPKVYAAESIPADPGIIPARVGADEDLLAGLSAGKSAMVRFDKCPGANFNAAERLGALMCDKAYTVFYEASTHRWVAIGPNAALVKANAQVTDAGAKNPGPPPSDKVVVVWGLTLKVDDTNQVLLADGVPVGHLAH